jgi:repressor LexA
MHEIQRKLLSLAESVNLAELTLREIGAKIGETSPQKVKHHLQQLEKRGLIRIDKVKGIIEKASAGFVSGLGGAMRLFAIPILGAANAGPAVDISDQRIEGYLRVSSTMLSSKRKADHLFALKVDGPSMNRVVIDGKRIEDGDYVIIDSSVLNPKNGDVVLSIIDGMANIKRFYRDETNKQVVLVSDSTQSFPPIYIHANDNYRVNGKVVQVIKKPKIKE